MSKRKDNNVLIIALLVLFFPAGFYLMIKSGWPKRVKWIVASAFAVWFLFLGAAYYYAPPTVEVANLRADAALIAEQPTTKLRAKFSLTAHRLL